jgi:hypothetical protein
MRTTFYGTEFAPRYVTETAGPYTTAGHTVSLRERDENEDVEAGVRPIKGQE